MEERENDCFGKVIMKDIPPMSTEQAIEVLHELDGCIWDTQQVALDMAFKSMEKLEQIEQIIKRTEAELGLDYYTVQKIREVLNG